MITTIVLTKLKAEIWKDIVTSLEIRPMHPETQAVKLSERLETIHII